MPADGKECCEGRREVAGLVVLWEREPRLLLPRRRALDAAVRHRCLGTVDLDRLPARVLERKRRARRVERLARDGARLRAREMEAVQRERQLLRFGLLRAVVEGQLGTELPLAHRLAQPRLGVVVVVRVVERPNLPRRDREGVDVRGERVVVPLQDLRRHVDRRPDVLGDAEALLGGELPPRPEVGDLDADVVPVVHGAQEQVLGLQVAVDDAARVEELHAARGVEDALHAEHGVHLLLVDVALERAVPDVLEDDRDGVRARREPDQPDDVRALRRREHADLAAHRVPLHWVRDDLGDVAFHRDGFAVILAAVDDREAAAADLVPEHDVALVELVDLDRLRRVVRLLRLSLELARASERLLFSLDIIVIIFFVCEKDNKIK